MEDIYSGMILYLIGFSGVGKRSIAKEIAHLTDMKIVDHLLIYDLLFKIIHKKDHVSNKSTQHIGAIKETLLDVIIDLSRMQQSFILTDELFEGNSEDKATFQKIKLLANKRGSTFIPVILKCSLPEIIRRFTSHDRSNEFKSTDAITAKQNFENHSIIQIRHENLINLDISNLSAAESAREILKRIERLSL